MQRQVFGVVISVSILQESRRVITCAEVEKSVTCTSPLESENATATVAVSLTITLNAVHLF